MTDKEDQQAREEGRLYKGDRVKVRDLVGKSWVVAQTIEGEWRDSYRRPRPTFAFIHDAVLDATGKRVSFTYWSPRGKGAMRYALMASLTADSEVLILTGRQGAVLAKELEEWEKNHWRQRLIRTGLTLGADPELFVVDKDNEVIPAWKFLPEKAEGANVTNSGYGTPSKAYWDGFQAEFTTRPAGCLAYFMDEINYGLRAVHSHAKKFDYHARLSPESVVPVDPETLATAEDKYVEFGCMPSMSAYDFTGQTHSGRGVPIRFAGGHLHLGISHYDLKPRLTNCVKALDAILGVACVSLFDRLDNPARREFYGLPGEYRLPPHGIEYRTLSNAWLVHPLVGNMVVELARGAFAVGFNGLNRHWKTPEQDVIDIIRSSDVERARASIADNSEMFDAVLGTTIMANDAKLARRCFMEGLDSFLNNPTDIEKNWDMGKPWISHCEGFNMNWTKARIPIGEGKKV